MKEKLLALAAIAAAGAFTAGCGSSSSSSGSSNAGLSYSAFSDAADKICMNGDTAIKSLNNLHVTSLAQAVGPFAKVDSVVSTMITQLQALHGPSTLEAARDTYVADLQQADTAIKSMTDAAKTNNISGFKAGALAFKQLGDKGKLDGSKLGAKSCASKS